MYMQASTPTDGTKMPNCLSALCLHLCKLILRKLPSNEHYALITIIHSIEKYFVRTSQLTFYHCTPPCGSTHEVVKVFMGAGHTRWSHIRTWMIKHDVLEGQLRCIINFMYIIERVIITNRGNRKAMIRNWSNQKPNPTLKTKMGHK